MKNEIWKPIPGFPGYEVSNLGRARSVGREITQKTRWGGLVTRNLRGRILAPNTVERGYKFVNLGERGRMRGIHRLVASAFIGGMPEGMEVNHIDFNPSNNRLENLEICTEAENKLHTARAGRRRRYTAHLTDLDIQVIRKSVRSYKRLARLFRTTEFSIHGIKNCKRSFKYVGAL